MAVKNLLKAEDESGFKKYLKDIGYEIIRTKGEYEQIRARNPENGKYVIVYRTSKNSGYLSVADSDVTLVKDFLNGGEKPKSTKSVRRVVKKSVKPRKSDAASKTKDVLKPEIPLNSKAVSEPETAVAVPEIKPNMLLKFEVTMSPGIYELIGFKTGKLSGIDVGKYIEDVIRRDLRTVDTGTFDMSVKGPEIVKKEEKE